jgi:hypothetical protein
MRLGYKTGAFQTPPRLGAYPKTNQHPRFVLFAVVVVKNARERLVKYGRLVFREKRAVVNL